MLLSRTAHKQKNVQQFLLKTSWNEQDLEREIIHL